MNIRYPQVPSLVIRVGTEQAPGPSSPGCSRLQIWSDEEGSDLAYCFELHGLHWVDVPTVASFGFDLPAEAVTAIPHLPPRPELIRETYLRWVLPLVLQAGGTEVLHASAVRMPRGVVALCGVSRVGKSTMAVALSRRGYPVWADDVIAMDTSATPITTVPLPFEIRLRRASVSFFRYEGPATGAPGSNVRAEAAVEPASLAAVCVLERADRVSNGVAVEVVAPSLAFPVVLTHGYCFSLQDPERKRRMMAHYLNLVARVPVFEVRFESGLERISKVLDAMERALT